VSLTYFVVEYIVVVVFVIVFAVINLYAYI